MVVFAPVSAGWMLVPITHLQLNFEHFIETVMHNAAFEL